MDEGLFIDKSKPKGGKSKKRVGGGKGMAGGPTSTGLGVKSGGVTKKTGGAWAAANAASSGARGKAVTERKSSKDRKQKKGESVPVCNGVAGKPGKKKRPGPALRRAMKEASAKEASAKEASAKEASGAGVDGEKSESLQKHGKPGQTGTDATRQESSGAKAKSAKKSVHGKKTLHVMTDEEKAKARAASYSGADRVIALLSRPTLMNVPL